MKKDYKLYGCNTKKESLVKIIEEDDYFKFTAYFKNIEKAENCFRNWKNYKSKNVVKVTYYLKLDNKWNEVVHKMVYHTR